MRILRFFLTLVGIVGITIAILGPENPNSSFKCGLVGYGLVVLGFLLGLGDCP